MVRVPLQCTRRKPLERAGLLMVVSRAKCTAHPNSQIVPGQRGTPVTLDDHLGGPADACLPILSALRLGNLPQLTASLP